MSETDEKYYLQDISSQSANVHENTQLCLLNVCYISFNIKIE